MRLLSLSLLFCSLSTVATAQEKSTDLTDRLERR
jgi:hypothetical protein